MKKCKNKIPTLDAHRRSIVTPQTKPIPEIPTTCTGDAPFVFPLDPGSDGTVAVGFAGFWTRIGSSLKEALPHALVNAGSLVLAKRLRSYNKLDEPLAALWVEVMRSVVIDFPPMIRMQLRHLWTLPRTSSVHKIAGSVPS